MAFAVPLAQTEFNAIQIVKTPLIAFLELKQIILIPVLLLNFNFNLEFSSANSPIVRERTLALTSHLKGFSIN